jgi:hypothetical protein
LIFVHNKELCFGFNATRISAYPVASNAVQLHRASIQGMATRTTERARRRRMLQSCIVPGLLGVRSGSVDPGSPDVLEVDRRQLDKVFGRIRLVRYSG